MPQGQLLQRPTDIRAMTHPINLYIFPTHSSPLCTIESHQYTENRHWWTHVYNSIMGVKRLRPENDSYTAINECTYMIMVRRLCDRHLCDLHLHNTFDWRKQLKTSLTGHGDYTMQAVLHPSIHLYTSPTKDIIYHHESDTDWQHVMLHHFSLDQ